MKQRSLHVALSLLIAAPWFYASAAVGQPNSYETPKSAPAGTGVTNYGSVQSSSSSNQPSPNKIDEPWPWMTKVEDKSQSGAAASPSPLETPPASSTTTSPLKMEKPATAPLQMEKPQTQASVMGQAKTDSSSQSAKQDLQQSKAGHTPIKLFGRIEQLSGSGGANFPVLKAMAPKLDTRDPRLKASVGSSHFSGTLVKSFPTNNEGTWGGTLQLYVEQLSPEYFAYDGEEARRTQQALHVGAQGNVNFQFQNLAGGKIALEPASVLFMVPMKDTVQADQMSKMFGAQGGANPFGAMVSQMSQSMQVPLTLNFGDINTAAAGGMEVSVTGGQLQSNVLKNDIRELAPGVYEQQIVTHQVTGDKSGKRHIGYGETVLRFTMRNPQQMFVQAASVNYGPQKQFFMKMILEGWVTKGVVTNTNPMNAMGGMGELQNLFGGQQAKPGASPTIPGIDPNMFKNMFGQ
jgi:hypothetical protein